MAPTAAAGPATATPVPATPAAAGEQAGGVELSAPFGFQLQIDPETQRIILEARDPVTGFVMFQSPPKTAFSSVGAAAARVARGKTVDQAL